MAKMEISNLTRIRIKQALSEGKRFDGRGLFDHRKIEIVTNVVKNAEGSARVKIGDTEVIAGVKIDTAEPYTDHEDEGTLITTAELLPLSSPRFESGPPTIEAIELARLVDRGVRESGFIDFKKLCIKEGEKVYAILLDIFSLNDDGNLLDAACLAAVAAMKSAKMPKYDEKEEKIKFGEFTKNPLPLTEKVPLTVTVHKIGNHIFVDPSSEEEESSEARITMELTKKGKEIMINACQKGGEETFTETEFEQVIDNAIEKFKFLEKEIDKSVK